MLAYLVVSVLALLSGSPVHSSSEAITVSGLLVDLYCWDTLGGFALDTGRQLRDFPQEHTVHCLIDVSLCRNSGFAIVHKPEGASQFEIQYYLDADGNRQALEAMGRVPVSDKYDRTGYNLTIRGRPGAPRGTGVTLITDLNDPGVSGETGTNPPVDMDDPTNGGGDGGSGGESGGSGGGSPGTGAIPPSITPPAWVIAHVIMAVIGFSVLMPIGGILPIVLKRDRFVGYHAGVMALGLLLGIIAFVVAVSNTGGIFSTHGQLGCAIVALVLLQTLMGACRPHKASSPQEEQSSARWLFELAHPNMGRALIIMIAAQVFLGYQLLNNFLNSESLYTWSFIHAIGVFVLYFIVLLGLKLSYPRVDTPRNSGPGVQSSSLQKLQDSPRGQMETV